MAYYVKLFLDAFDGESLDMKMLSPAQRYIWFALLAFARRYQPHGFLSVGTDENGPIQASVGRLAEWAGVSKSTMHCALELMIDADMLRIDKRRKVQCIEVVNWQKWQVDNGLEEVPEFVREPNDSVREPNDSVREPNDSVREPNDSVREPNGYLPNGSVREPNGTPDEPNGDRASGQVQLSGETVREPNALESLESLESLEKQQRKAECRTQQVDVRDGAAPTGRDGTPPIAFDLVATCKALLDQVNPEPNFDIEPSIRNVTAPYPDFAHDAAIQTVAKFQRTKPHGWMDVFMYFHRTAAGMTSDAREAEATDPRLAEFCRIYGQNPRKSPDHPKQHEWETHLKLYRRDPLIYLLENPRFREKAAAQGLWNHDTDIDRAKARYREREAELVKQGRMLPD